MLTVRDLMAPNPVTVAPENTLRAAADLLTTAGVGGAPVVSGGMVIGVVTLTDILAFEVDDPGVRVVQPETLDLEPGEEPEPDEGDGIPEPVSSWFLGMWDVEGPDAVTRMEEAEGPGWNALDEHTVAEVMSRAIIHIAPTEPVSEAARIMERERIHRLIVLENGTVAGILTSFDLVRAVARGQFQPAPPA
jgi:CBS domain-containing protein